MIRQTYWLYARGSLEKMIFSKDHEACQKCKYYDDCDNKRMVACAVFPERPLTAPLQTKIAQPLMNDIAVKHNYRDIKINESMTITIDLEEQKERMRQEIYKRLGCPFLSATDK